MADLQIGDVVILKSEDSPQMTVKSVDSKRGLVICQWFVDCKELQEGDFPIQSLKKLD